LARYTDPGHIPGPVFIPSVAAIRLVWQLPNGKFAHNILHGRYVTAPTVDQAWINSLFSAITAALSSSGHNSSLHTLTLLAQVGYRNLAQQSPGVGYGEWLSSGTAAAGTATGDALPANVAFVVSLKTGLSLQANRGRVYLPGFAESANSATGTAGTGVGDKAVAFVQAVSAALGAAGRLLTLCIAHPARKEYESTTGAIHPARPAGAVDVTSIVKLNDVWDSTRLRSLS
jgi:hypothetical protein